jgi:hypothetical protein
MKKLIVNTLSVIFVLASTNTPIMAQTFSAEQYVQSATIELNGTIERVFPLFTPLGEKNWAEGWDPKMISPSTGSMQEGLIFQTPDHLHGAPPLTWVVSHYSLTAHQVRYIVTSPLRVAVISVTCTASGKVKTTAVINYILTGMTPEGNELSRHLIGKMFASNLRDWETAINAYLK